MDMNLREYEQFHILLADDDPDDREFFSEAIAELEINKKMVLFSGGKDLIDYLDSATQIPNLLFLDLNMPCKNGMDCLREIRKNSVLDSMSIVIYSTSSSENDIEESFLQGADIYIKKPNDFSKLKSIIQDIIISDWNKSSGLKKDFSLFSL